MIHGRAVEFPVFYAAIQPKLWLYIRRVERRMLCAQQEHRYHEAMYLYREWARARLYMHYTSGYANRKRY
jgi:hypothetical protein